MGMEGMRAACRAVCLAAALLLVACPIAEAGANAAAASPAPAVSPYADTIGLINAGRFDEARALAVATAKTERARRLNLMFVDALILKHQGRYAEAAAALRALLAENPGFDRVRGELADTLFLMGDDKAAGYQFGLLSASASTTAQHNLYGRYLDAIRSRRPFNWDAYISFAPSSNLNGGTDNGMVLVGGAPFTTEKRKSGVGIAYGASATYRHDIDASREIVFGASIAGAAYTEHRFDKTTLQGFTEFARDFGPWRAGVGIGGEWALGDWQTYRTGIGPQASLSRSFGRAGSLIATASWRAMKYATDTYLDGSEAALALRYSYAFSPATTVALGAAVTRRDTTMSMHNYTGVRPSIELYHEMPNGLIGDLSVSYEHRFYDSDYFLLTEPRRDEILDVALGVTFRRLSWSGFAPRLEYDFEMYNSNSEHGNTISHGLGLTLTKHY
jgi:hypothetical protein